jgi:membrane fusion protein, multidrug efflux system
VEVVTEIASAPPTVIAGSFAQLVALAGAPVPRPAVPQAALHASERGYLAMVAVRDGDQEVARSRLVETGLRSPDGWVEIRSGLAIGDRLIVRGADGLRDGQAVAATLAPTPTPTPAADPAGR